MHWVKRISVTFVITYLIAIEMTLGKPAQKHDQYTHRKLRHARIRAIKEEILTKLGMREIPSVRNVTLSVEEEREKIRLFRKSFEDTYERVHELFSQEDYLAKTYYSFRQSDYSRNLTVRNDNSSIRIHFNVHIPQPTDPKKQTHVHSAKLKLYRWKVSPQHVNVNDLIALDSGVRVNVYQLLEDPVKEGPLKRLVDSTIVSLRETGWGEFHLQQTVQQWMDNPDSNFGVELSCDNYDINHVIEFAHIKTELNEVTGRNVVGSDVDMDLMPSLDVYSQDKMILGRQKRAEETYDCVQGDGENRCCRYPLWVSFKDIGWDKWIVEPEGYQAYYCDGDCPHRYKMAHTFAGVQALVNINNPAAAPAPCCSATKLSPLSLLHYNESRNLVVSVYEDMIIKECQCT